jgi:hypothetical protein
MTCRNFKDAQGLLATKESNYNAAQKAAEEAGQRLPLAQKEHDTAAREAKEAALAAQRHADGMDHSEFHIAMFATWQFST